MKYRSKGNNINSHLKLEKEKQIRPQSKQKEDTRKIRADISEIENKNSKLEEHRSLFLRGS